MIISLWEMNCLQDGLHVFSNVPLKINENTKKIESDYKFSFAEKRDWHIFLKKMKTAILRAWATIRKAAIVYYTER